MFETIMVWLTVNLVTLISVFAASVFTLGAVKFRAYKASQPKNKEMPFQVLFKNMIPSKNGKYIQLLLATNRGVLRLPYTVESIELFDRLTRNSRIHATIANKNLKKVDSLKTIDIEGLRF